MKGEPKVIEYLNNALRHELTAVNQYWLHYRLLDNWGYLALAKQWRKESIEEMQHADKLIERIIFLDGSPNMQTLDSLHIGQNVKEVLDSDLAAELSARSLYQEAATHCHNVKDYVSRDLFEKLMGDEEHHIDFLETQIDLVGKGGDFDTWSFQEDREGLMRALVYAPVKHNVLIKDATHFVLFEKHRDQFFEEILKFLKE
jgi:bacterioferritin